jgi:hypothetical protein
MCIYLVCVLHSGPNQIGRKGIEKQKEKEKKMKINKGNPLPPLIYPCVRTFARPNEAKPRRCPCLARCVDMSCSLRARPLHALQPTRTLLRPHHRLASRPCAPSFARVVRTVRASFGLAISCAILACYEIVSL